MLGSCVLLGDPGKEKSSLPVLKKGGSLRVALGPECVSELPRGASKLVSAEPKEWWPWAAAVCPVHRRLGDNPCLQGKLSPGPDLHQLSCSGHLS